MAGNATERNAAEGHAPCGTHAHVTLGAQARAIIERLALEPHPEGGWFRRTWASPIATGQDGYRYGGETAAGRPLASLIYFLLPAGDASDWHKVDADEIWLWHGPATVTLELGGDGDRPVASAHEALGDAASEATHPRIARYRLGSPIGALADEPAVGHAVVPKGVWQRTIPGCGDALVSCVVSPAFTFDGFELD